MMICICNLFNIKLRGGLHLHEKYLLVYYHSVSKMENKQMHKIQQLGLSQVEGHSLSLYSILQHFVCNIATHYIGTAMFI